MSVDMCHSDCECGRYDDATLTHEDVHRCCVAIKKGRIEKNFHLLDTVAHKIMARWSGGHEFGPFRRCPVQVLVATIVYWIEESSLAELFRKAHGCSHCGRLVRTKSCPCKTVRYCCPSCQNAHWPEHKRLCKHIFNPK